MTEKEIRELRQRQREIRRIFCVLSRIKRKTFYPEQLAQKLVQNTAAQFGKIVSRIKTKTAVKQLRGR